MFTSPSSSRWGGGKQGNCAIGFGMELPDDDECLKVRKLLKDEFPICLCNIGDMEYSRINLALKTLNFLETPEKIERKSLFGRQFRYLFATTTDIALALDNLIGALQAYATNHILMYTTIKDVNLVKLHKLIQLNFDVDNRFFYNIFISNLICCLVVEELRKLEKRKMWEELNRYKNRNVSIYVELFEKYGISLLLVENDVVFRSLGSQEDCKRKFPKSKRKFFSYVIHPPIQIWYEDIDHHRMLGTSAIDEDILYYPTDRICYTVDAILLQRRISREGQNQISVNFLQVITSKKHDVSPGAFFAMFMLVKLIKFKNPCVRVFFFFIVPGEVYGQFNSSKARYLRDLFEDIQIHVLKFDEKQRVFQNSDGKSKPPKEKGNGTDIPNGETKQKKKLEKMKIIELGKEKKINEEIKLLKKKETEKKENMDEELKPQEEKGNGTDIPNGESSVEEENVISKDCSITLSNISITPAGFNGVNLKLFWNRDIECVIENSIATVNKSLNRKKDNKEFNLSEHFNCFGNTIPMNNFHFLEQNIEQKLASQRKKKKKSSSPSETKSNETIPNIGLENKNSHLKDIPRLFWKYLEICTLFYKNKSSRETWKDNEILNLLPQVKLKIDLTNDESNIFEINFDMSYKEEEICILLGCFNLHLLNIYIQNLQNVWNVKLKFYPSTFDLQIEFLKKISKILVMAGIYLEE
jgi:hypothetical protein